MSTVARTIVCRVAATAVACLLAVTVARADLVSHRATYTMTGRGAEVAALDGRMALVVADACDGWTLEQRIALRIVDPDGAVSRSYTSFTSWESKDGRRFRFEQETKHDGHTTEKISGLAEIEEGKWGTAYLTKPEAMDIALPPGTLFPSQHTVQLLARVKAGDRHFLRIVFDGTTLENPNQISAFIGRSKVLPKLYGSTRETTVWPVRLAFFSLGTRALEPDVEIGLLLQADGVAREVDLDYGGFTVHGELDEFELLPPVDC